MATLPRSTRLNSKSSVKCGACKKLVKDSDPSAIGCSSCNCWFHGDCVKLSLDDVTWLGSKPNVQWICDVCLDSKDECSSNPTEAKLTSLFNDFHEKLSSSISDLVPQLIKETIPSMHDNVKEAVANSLPSYSDIVARNKKVFPQTDLQFVITGLVETESTYFKQVEKDSFDVKEIVQHMGLQAEGNVTGLRRLGKIAKPISKYNNVSDAVTAKPNSEANITAGPKRCRPFLVTISNSYFMENCFARSHYLQNYKYPVYIKKFLSSTDRQLEKDILAKRYHMINVEGKKKSDFRIKNLKLYYKDDLVDVVTK